MMKIVSILGSTGSIGTQTLEVIARHPERIRVASLAAGKNQEKLKDQILKFSPEFVAVPDRESAEFLKQNLADFRGKIEYGPQALTNAVHPKATHVVVAVVGSLGLLPTLKALSLGKIVALANKETLVAGGHLVKKTLSKNGGKLIPVDSEHSAIFQCLKGENSSAIAKIWLTASGGPFRGFTKEQLRHVTKKQVLTHPVWKMGNKITVDSASLMNKGLEVIEAKWLFDIPPEKIQVILHPQGIVHSLVEFRDRSVMAQMGLPDMRTPIQLALSYPERWEAPAPSLNLMESAPLTFEPPDPETFPLLKCAYQVAETGGTMPAVFNAANEEAVQLFLEDRISFLEISELVQAAVSLHENLSSPNLEEILEADRRAREFIRNQKRLSAKEKIPS